MLQMVIDLPESTSLKDKRRTVKSLKDRLQQKFRLSVAEVDLHDSVTLAHIGAVLVSNSRQHGEAVLSKALSYAEELIAGRIQATKIFSQVYQLSP